MPAPRLTVQDLHGLAALERVMVRRLGWTRKRVATWTKRTLAAHRQHLRLFDLRPQPAKPMTLTDQTPLSKLCYELSLASL